jgi:hypothetical protein
VAQRQPLFVTLYTFEIGVSSRVSPAAECLYKLNGILGLNRSARGII